jgi:hypothetical protein
MLCSMKADALFNYIYTKHWYTVGWNKFFPNYLYRNSVLRYLEVFFIEYRDDTNACLLGHVEVVRISNTISCQASSIIIGFIIDNSHTGN